MADKRYKLTFEMTDGTSREVVFSAPQGEPGQTGAKGDKGDKGETGATGSQGPKGDTGSKGADGKTPVKGTDYFTAADKAEMVAAVVAALPVYGGETV